MLKGTRSAPVDADGGPRVHQLTPYNETQANVFDKEAGTSWLEALRQRVVEENPGPERKRDVDRGDKGNEYSRKLRRRDSEAWHGWCVDLSVPQPEGTPSRTVQDLGKTAVDSRV